MQKTLTIALAIIGGILISALIFGAGLMVAHANIGTRAFGPFNATPAPGAGPGQGYSMMGNGYNGMMGNGYNGMMGYGSSSPASATPLSIDQAKQAVTAYLKGLNNSDLELKEIMVFDNNAYARITEKSTGIGAMELLVDPATLSVFPEYGPNMMWNLKYGHMGSAGGMMGGIGGMLSGRNGTTLSPAPRRGMGGSGMMGGYNNYSNNTTDVSAAMTVTAEQAAKIAQQYLDQQFPGYKAATEPDPFYGYYTIDILKDGKPTGMLSVNGSSGQVFLHTWHGTFIEMWE